MNISFVICNHFYFLETFTRVFFPIKKKKKKKESQWWLDVRMHTNTCTLCLHAFYINKLEYFDVYLWFCIKIFFRYHYIAILKAFHLKSLSTSWNLLVISEYLAQGAIHVLSLGICLRAWLNLVLWHWTSSNLGQ